MSGASVSSYGSAPGSVIADGLRPSAGDEDHIHDEPHTIQLGIFGVLYTVSKEKELTSVKFAFFRLFLDFLQLWLLVVNPNYGWAINAKSRAWQVVSFIQLNTFLTARGYDFFLALFYVFVGLLGVNLALSIWVAYSFSNNRFEYVWPIQFLRWFGLIFYQVLDIATLTLLLVALECNYFGVPEDSRFYNQEFPEVMCWTMPHIIHVTVSVSSIVVFVIMATCMVLSEMELNPLTRNYMAISFTRDEGFGFAIKTIVTIASVMLPGSMKALSLVHLFFFSLLLFTYVKWVPFIYGALNYVRCGSYGTVVYSSVLLVVLSFGPSGEEPEAARFRERVTLALWVGMGPAALMGALLCHLRLHYINKYVVQAFRDAEAGTNSKSIHRFTDAREVAIAARCCRHWIDEDTLEPEAVALSEQIIKAGMIQLPQDPKMIILYSSFLIDVQGSYQSGYTQLQTAKKQPLGLLERFAIFSREQEHTQKASGAHSGDAAVDLVSYVEFQRNHRLVVRAHREALLAIRSFWGLLLRSRVNFNALSKALHRIEVTVKAAERAYRGVLIRHANSARIVRLYGKFLETVKFDPWAAAKWYTEADKLEEAAEHSKEAMQLGGIETLLPQGASADKGLSAIEGVAFICINAQGQIQVASPEAHSLLGYAKNELKGRDLGIIMPAPFAERHTAYVRSYILTGASLMLGKHIEVMVITKTRRVIPVRMHVTKISGLNEDSVFLGVLEPVPSGPGEARLWVMGNGLVVAADTEASDWLGYDTPDLAGRQLEELMVEKELVRETIKSWNRAQAGTSRTNPRQRRNSSSVGEGILAVMGLPSPSPPVAGGGADSDAAGALRDRSRNPGISWLRRASFVEPAAVLMSPVGHGTTFPGGGGGGGGGVVVGGGGGGGANEVPSNTAPPPMVMPRAAWRHKYLENMQFDTFIHPGAIGSVKIHSVIVRRCTTRPSYSSYASRLLDPSYREMLLVADNQGRVLHVTAALAAALGRNVESIRAGGLALMVPEPISVLHGPWLQELSNPQAYGPLSNPQTKVPPYSCRSGLAVSLSSYNALQGAGTKQFRVSVSQRLAEGGGSKIHIASMTPCSLDQALAERRMKLTLDLRGNIIDADGATPADLFGADPRVLVGSSIAQLLDLFEKDELYDEAFAPPLAAMDLGFTPQQQQAVAGAAASGTVAGHYGMMARSSDDVVETAKVMFQAAFARRITRALLQLSKRSTETPDCSWRVGVKLPPDGAALAELQELAALGALGPEEMLLASQLTEARTAPAVMKLRLVRRKPQPPQQAQLRAQMQQQQRMLQDTDAALPLTGINEDVGYRASTNDATSGAVIYGSSGGAANSLTAGTAPIFRTCESVLSATELSRRAAPGRRGSGAYGGGYANGYGAEYQNAASGGFGSAVNFPVSAAPPPQSRLPGQGPAADSSGDVRLVLPTSGESRYVYQSGFGSAGGNVGFQLPHAPAELQTPVRLDTVIETGDTRLSQQIANAVQQGVWAPVTRSALAPTGPSGMPGFAPAAPAPAAPAAEAAAEKERARGAAGGNGRGGVWYRGILGYGPVAEAVEQHTSAAADPAAIVLDRDDEAVLEQLENCLDESALPSAGTSSHALAAPGPAGQSAGPSSTPSRRSTPPALLPPTGLTGVGVLAAAVAAAVERGPYTRPVAAAAAPARAVKMTPRASFNSQGSTGTPRGPPTPSDSRPPYPETPQQSQQLPTTPPAPAASTGPTPRTSLLATSIQQPPSQSVSRSQLLAASQPAAGAASYPVSLRLLRRVDSGTFLAASATAAVTAGVMSPAALLEGEPVAAATTAAELSGPGLVFEVELWRADLLSGVLEVDDKGKVLRADPVCPLGQAGLVLGCPPTAISGAPVSDLISLPGGSGSVLALLEAASPGGVDSAPRGALKKRGSRTPMLGGTTVVTVRHQSDGCALDVQVTAVRRAGPYGSAYLILRPSAPACVRSGFLRWLYDNDTSGLMPLQRRITIMGNGAFGNAGGAVNSALAKGLMSRVASLDQVALAGATAPAPGGPNSPSRLGSMPRALSLMHGDKVPEGAASASMLRGNTSSSTAGGLPPPPSPPPVTSIEGPPVSGSLRVAAIRSSLMASNGAAPSRLSVTSKTGQGPAGAAASGVAGEVVDSVEIPGVMQFDRGASAATSPTPTDAARKGPSPGSGGDDSSGGLEQDLLVSALSLDTAFERGGIARLPADAHEGLASTGGPRSGPAAPGFGMVPAPHVRAANTPREGATLMAGAELAVQPRETSRRGRLPDAKASMVQSWVLSDGREHTPGMKLARVNSLPSLTDVAAKPNPFGLPSPSACDIQDGGSDGGGGGGLYDGGSGVADGDGRSSDSRNGGEVAEAGGDNGDNGKGRNSSGGGDESVREGTEDVESEAGALVANYSVGKRFKKLHKILMSPLALQPVFRLRLRAFLVMVLLMTAHTITFTLLLIKLIDQKASVTDLHSVANAARNVHEIAIGSRVLESLYSNKSYAPGLDVFGDPLPDALTSVYDDLAEATESMKSLHHGVYLGFRKLRRMSARYGLRSIWDDPTYNVSLYYDLDDPSRPTGMEQANSTYVEDTVPMGLWDVGNFYLAKAFDIINNGPEVVKRGEDFATWSSWMFVHDNGVGVLFDGYLATLNALVELTVAESQSIYQLQLIVLILEGGLLCLFMCSYMWMVSHQYSKKRHDLYSVFLQIPLGVTRGLANMSLKLEANNEEEDSDNDLNPELIDSAAHDHHGGNGGSGPGMVTEGLLTDGAIKAAAMTDRRSAVGNSISGAVAVAAAAAAAAGGAGGGQRRRTSFMFGGKSMGAEETGDNGESGGSAKGSAATPAQGGMSSKLRAIPFAILSLTIWRRKSRVSPLISGGASSLQHRTKRCLISSHKLALRLVLPFILWGMAIISVNLVGYFHLKSMSAPIATLNVVNIVVIRFHRVEFYTLEVAAALNTALCNMLKPLLSAELTRWIFEYGVMLYGRKATGSETDVHFRLVTTGVVFGGFSQPAELLYHTGTCLALDPEDCQPEDSPYYEATRNGLDVIVKSQFLEADSLVHQSAEASNLNSSEFKFIWSTGQTDAEGGLVQLGNVFLDAVLGSYSEVVVQQIVLFCVSWVVALLFLFLMLRPIVRKAQNEMRQVAELLSQLPQEVDCEGMVLAVTLGDQGFGRKSITGSIAYNMGAGNTGPGPAGAMAAGGVGGVGAGSANKQPAHPITDLATAAFSTMRRSGMGFQVARGDTANAKDGE